jgi:UDP-N-acetylglucosamine--N-acetylmuramyl-(pentapeptide) pyrophosphoryl-undecaprenol N-acetylglucosamine transferase
VAYEGMEQFFPKEKILLTGNPVRQDIHQIAQKKEEALQHFQLDPKKQVILIIGGSLGARVVNEAIRDGLDKIGQAGIQLIWQTGKQFYEEAKKNTESKNGMGIYAFDFISRMDLAYAAADIVISRAGASSISEICNIGLPGILVPSPNVAEDHQTKNAMALVNKNAAILVKDADAAKSLVITALELIKDESRRKDLSKNCATMAFPYSAERIADEVIQLALQSSVSK